MAVTVENLKATLSAADHPLGIQELMRFTGSHPGAQTELKRMLRELVRSGAVVREGKRFSLAGVKHVRKDAQRRELPKHEGAVRERARPEPARRAKGGAAPARREPRAPARSGGKPVRSASRGGMGREIEGKLSIHRDGFGFVRVEDGEDIFLPASQARQALDNDRVRVQVVGGSRSTEGRLLEVVGRTRREAVGTYVPRGDGTAFVQPRDLDLPGVIEVPATQLAQSGDVVRVRLGVGADLTPRGGLFGEVSGSLGKPGSPSQEVLSVAYSQGFSDQFPGDVMDGADAIALKVTAQEASEPGRRDLRRLGLVTIDGADARDFDDAVHAEELADGGFRLWVAIADVTHYVREGTALDKEALQRATSVYLPDRVLPMLPERLSNGICSLRPDEDRLCLVAQMDFDAEAQVGATELYPGVMRSAARCTYEEVQAVLDGDSLPGRDAFRPQFQILQSLARKLRAMRAARGAIDFDLPESKTVVDEEGQPVRVERRERKESHRLIEECMLAANEAVAKFFLDRELPSVYRYHGNPDEEKLETFARLARAFGFKFQAKQELTSKELNAFVKQLEGHPEQRALNQLLLRSMMQAVYSSESVGHYGLAAEQYLHFTSPIRRYPDLLVHRLLKAYWSRGSKAHSERERERETERLASMALHCSERERSAMGVEREVNAYYATLLMQDRVGEVFEATVSSLVEFGLFVELDSENIEGLIKTETLGPGAKFNAEQFSMALPGGRRLRVGQKLQVRLTAVNVNRRQIDFQIEVPDAKPSTAASVEGRRPRQSVPPSSHRAESVLPSSHGHRPVPGRRVTGLEAPREVSESPAESPHPGFDRLRALAMRAGKGGGAPTTEGGLRAAPPPRGKTRHPPGKKKHEGKGDRSAGRGQKPKSRR